MPTNPMNDEMIVVIGAMAVSCLLGGIFCGLVVVCLYRRKQSESSEVTEKVADLVDNNTQIQEQPSSLWAQVEKDVAIVDLGRAAEEGGDSNEQPALPEGSPSTVSSLYQHTLTMNAEPRTDDGTSKGSTNDEDGAVRWWLADEVGLPQYFDVFIANGYGCLDIIAAMDSESDLDDLGIVSDEHRAVLWAAITSLHAQREKEGGESVIEFPGLS